jgi:hypothetical protein
VLLLHQQVHFVEAVKCSSVFLGVVLKRFLQSKECDTALVLELITHDAHAGRDNNRPAKELAKISGVIGLS